MADELNKTINFKIPKDRYNDFLGEDYEFNESHVQGDYKDPKQVKSIHEMVRCLENDKSIQIEANVLCKMPDGSIGVKKIERDEFLEAYKKGESNWKGVDLSKFREGVDSFATDCGDGVGSGLIGQDFVPLLGGPFYKNLYFYDYVKQANAAFYAYHHDPIAHQAVNIVKDFTLGRGFRVDASGEDEHKKEKAVAIWRAFEKANKLQTQFDQMATEISVNGEVMWWWLPNHDAKIVQDKYAGQPVPKAFLPRIRLIDATVFWEIVTEPEDITSVLFYVWVAPTQWQLYNGLDDGKGGVSQLPTSKFIFQTIPAEQILHYKVNAFSNEKRGRSDLFSVLGFLKRLRDSVNYSLVALQKQAAYCVDTTIEGNQSDINAYITDQQQGGTIAPAGSEFVHSAKIKREYKGVEGTGKGGGNVTFEWALSCVAAGMGIPISYFGTHLSGGQTKASAIVATEPVAKRFEARQKLYENIIHDMWEKVMEWANIDGVECEVTFPEIITQDRSQKVQDLTLCMTEGLFSKERVATILAKDFNMTDYEFEEEMGDVAIENPQPDAPMANPLSSPGKEQPEDKQQDEPEELPSPANAVTGKDRSEIKKNGH